MKSVLLSVRPEWVAKILNGEKTIEIRKKFPKDYVGWVYIYCTKNGNDYYGMPTDLVDYRGCAIYNKFKLMPKGEKVTTDDNQPRLNGKVIARFWCDKVENIIFGTTLYNDLGFFTGDLYDFDLYKQSCLTKKEMRNYLKVKPNGLSGYAIHITKLEIFDKPKDISEFETRHWNSKNPFERDNVYELTRAPQSWCYIEV